MKSEDFLAGWANASCIYLLQQLGLRWGLGPDTGGPVDKIRAEDACAGAELGRESAGGVRDSPRTRSRLCRFARVAVTKCQLGLRQQSVTLSQSWRSQVQCQRAF